MSVFFLAGPLPLDLEAVVSRPPGIRITWKTPRLPGMKDIVARCVP